MIVDTSAAVALLRNEPAASDLRRKIEGAPVLRMSAGSVLELAMVIGHADPGLTDAFIDELGIQVLSVDQRHLVWARRGFEMYGRNSGSPARLNYGDCLTYGAAKATGEPLLCVVEDFPHTDVTLA